VEAPDLATVKDFLRFCAAKGKGKIMEKITLRYAAIEASGLSPEFSLYLAASGNQERLRSH
jgi:hypothetical protein